jgi:hypothetical protein
MSTDSINSKNSSAQRKPNRTTADQSRHKTVKQSVDSAAAIRAMAPQLVRDLLRCEALQKQVDVAFCGNVFLPHQSAISLTNLKRFKLCFQMMKSLTMLKIKLIHELMRVHGVNPDNPHEMWETGIPGGIGAVPTIAKTASSAIASRKPTQTYSQEAVGLAEHLTKHAHSVKEPFKVESYKTTIDREEVHGRTKPN